MSKTQAFRSYQATSENHPAWCVFSTVKDIIGTLGDIMSTVGHISDTFGGYHVYSGDIIFCYLSTGHHDRYGGIS